ncbi:MAG TPA: hypothetical protein V6D11_20400 [Waterburya sp.]|jgi:hypothetical protein
MALKLFKSHFLKLGITSAIALTPLIFVGMPGFTESPSSLESSSSDNINPSEKSIVSKMYVERFDAKVAASNGYEIKTLSDGRQYSVLKNPSTSQPSASNGVVTASNVVKGNCGESWIYFNAIGNLQGSLSTGFRVKAPAISYGWRVDVTDQVGVGTLRWGGLLFRSAWQGTKRTQSGAKGYAIAKVNPSGSYALLSDGSICVSGGPSASTRYY